MYVDSLVCQRLRVKGSENEWFRIDSDIKTRVFNLPLALQCMYGCIDGGESGDGKEGSKISGGGGE